MEGGRRWGGGSEGFVRGDRLWLAGVGEREEGKVRGHVGGGIARVWGEVVVGDLWMRLSLASVRWWEEVLRARWRMLG